MLFRSNELSALYDTPHGATLSIIMGSWMRYVFEKKPERFARYAEKVFGVERREGKEGTLEAARKGIEETEKFFRSLDMPISFSDFRIPEDGIEEMLDHIPFRGEDDSIGGIVRLNREDCRNIYVMAL